MISDNGGYSTTEPRPSELLVTEDSLFPSNIMETTGNKTTTLVLPETGEENLFKESDGSEEAEETSEIKELDASMSKQAQIDTTLKPSGTNAIMD